MNVARVYYPKIVGIGAGGHCRVLIDLIRQAATWEIHGLLDSSPDRAGTELDGIAVLGDDSLSEMLWHENVRAAFLGLGSIGDSALRRGIHERFTEFGFEFPVLVHPKALVAGSVMVGDGSCVMQGAILNPGCGIGIGAIVNSGAIIEHDCWVGDFAHISPGAILGGGVDVGEGAHVGIGAVVRQGLRIGSNALIGAGAVVVKDVAEGATVVGVPAGPIGRHS